MHGPFDIELAEGTSSGLAVTLRGLIVENLERRPEREASFRRLKTTVLIRAEDVDASVTLDFRTGGHLRIYDGEVGSPQIRILGDWDAILALTRMPLWLGLPDARAEPARVVLKRQLGGELTVRGLVLRLPQVVHLLRALAGG